MRLVKNECDTAAGSARPEAWPLKTAFLHRLHYEGNLNNSHHHAKQKWKNALAHICWYAVYSSRVWSLSEMKMRPIAKGTVPLLSRSSAKNTL
uniref:Uncharacterized protein n=1 Tax=Salarias fasciatus TaxID=181472 RepID=A0A672JMR5_SALFA